MPSSRVLISSQTLGSSAASVTFSGIPSGYRDLILKCSIRDTQSSQWVSSFLRVNGISDVYTTVYLRGSGSAVVSGRSDFDTNLFVANTNGSTSTSNTFANLEVYIPSYNDTAAWNAISYDNAGEDNSTSPVYRLSGAGLFKSNAAITSLAMVASTSFATGSSFYLYGLLPA